MTAPIHRKMTARLKPWRSFLFIGTHAGQIVNAAYCRLIDMRRRKTTLEDTRRKMMYNSIRKKERKSLGG